MTKTIKAMLAIVALLVVAVFATADASAYSAYTGRNTIGGVLQYTWGTGWQSQAPTQAPAVQFNLPYHTYQYPTVPNQGGWFGGGVGWLTGLRQPVTRCVAPGTYSYFHQGNCGPQGVGGGWWGNGYGYGDSGEYEWASISVY